VETNEKEGVFFVPLGMALVMGLWALFCFFIGQPSYFHNGSISGK